MLERPSATGVKFWGCGHYPACTRTKAWLPQYLHHTTPPPSAAATPPSAAAASQDPELDDEMKDFSKLCQKHSTELMQFYRKHRASDKRKARGFTDSDTASATTASTASASASALAPASDAHHSATASPAPPAPSTGASAVPASSSAAASEWSDDRTDCTICVVCYKRIIIGREVGGCTIQIKHSGGVIHTNVCCFPSLDMCLPSSSSVPPVLQRGPQDGVILYTCSNPNCMLLFRGTVLAQLRDSSLFSVKRTPLVPPS
jgi:hypothetical protein